MLEEESEPVEDNFEDDGSGNVCYMSLDHEDNFEMIDQMLHILGWMFGHLEDPGHERIPFDPIPFSD